VDESFGTVHLTSHLSEARRMHRSGSFSPNSYFERYALVN